MAKKKRLISKKWEVELALALLTEKERLVVEHRFKIGKGGKMDPKQLRRATGYKWGKVLQVEREAIKTMRKGTLVRLDPNPQPKPFKVRKGTLRRQEKTRVKKEDQGKRRRMILQRAQICQSIGFSDYGRYLKSSLWRGIRDRVLQERPQCEVCHQEATEVHHDSYIKEVLLGENLEYLVSLCQHCHRDLEYERGTKRKWSQVCSIAREKIPRLRKIKRRRLRNSLHND